MAILREAQTALFQVLDQYTLAGLLAEPMPLHQLLVPLQLTGGKTGGRQ